MEPATIGLIISALMSAGSVAANKHAQDKDIVSRNRKLAAESARQEELQKQADIANLATQKEFTRPKQDQLLEEQTARRNQFMQQATKDPVVSQPMTASGSAPKIVGSEMARAVGDAVKAGRGLNEKQARLGGYGSTQFLNSLNLGRTGERLAQVNNASIGSSNIVPMELQAANRAGDSQRGLADLFRAGSTVASTYGATRKPAQKTAQVSLGN